MIETNTEIEGPLGTVPSQKEIVPEQIVKQALSLISDRATLRCLGAMAQLVYRYVKPPKYKRDDIVCRRRRRKKKKRQSVASQQPDTSHQETIGQSKVRKKCGKFDIPGCRRRRLKIWRRPIRCGRRNLCPQGGKEPKKEKKKPPPKKPTSPWSTKLADFRRDLKQNGIVYHEEQGLTTWVKTKVITSQIEETVAFMEGLTTLIGAVLTSTSIANLSFILGMYAQRYYSGSVLFKARELIKGFCMSEQGDSGEPEWLSYLKTVNSDWKKTVQNPAFGKISELLGMFVAMGILSTSHVDFEIAGVRIFAKQVQEKHVNATGLIDAILSTVTYFAEGGYYAIKTGSIKPLLFGSQEILKYDEEYCELTSLFSAALAGNLIQMDTSFEEFEHRVTVFLEKGNELVAILPGGFERKLIMDRLVSIKKDFSEFTQKRLQGGSREAPLMMSVFGKSGVGKSTFVDFLVPYILKVNQFACSDEYITTLNPNSKHETNWRSYMTAMKLDDWNNSKADKTEVNPAQKIIDYCNNVRCHAEMPDLERKGKTVIEPKVISITTNTRDLGARDFSNEPASIVRRPKWHIELSVKPEFCKSGSHELDTEKVEKVYGDSDVVIHDIWLASLSYVKIIPGKDKRTTPKTRNPKKPATDTSGLDMSNKFHVPDDFAWVPYKDKQGPLIDVPLSRLLPFLVEKSREHFSGQSFVTRSTKDVGDRLKLCDTCSLPIEWCTCDTSDSDSSKSPPPDGSDSVVSSITQTDRSCERIITYLEPEEDPFPEATQEDIDAQIAFDEIKYLSNHGGFENPISSSIFVRLYVNLCNWTSWIEWKRLSQHAYYWSRLERRFFTFLKDWCTTSHTLMSLAEELTIVECYAYMKKIDESKWFRWTSYMPEWLVNDPGFVKYAVMSRRDAVSNYRTCNLFFKIGTWVQLISIMLMSRGKTRVGYFGVYAFFFGAWISFRSLRCRHLYQKKVMKSIQEDREMMPVFIKNVREDYLNFTIKTFALVATIYATYRLYKQFDTTITAATQSDDTPQAPTNLDDPTADEVRRRDAKGEDKFWVPAYSTVDYDSLPKSKWTNHDELLNIVQKNLLYVRFHYPNEVVKVCDGLMLTSNYLLVPNHMITEECKLLSCIRKPVDGVCQNATFQSIIDKTVCYRIPKHDLCVIYISNSGDFADIKPAFPTEYSKIVLPFTMYWRNAEGNLQEFHGLSTPKMVCVQNSSYMGCSYTLDKPTFKGLCMAPLIGRTKHPTVLGVHLAGVTGAQTGVAVSPLRMQLEAAVTSLKDRHTTIFPSVSMGDFPKEQYGKSTEQGACLKKSSPITKVKDTNCRVYGSCPGSVHSKSKVRELQISKTVSEVFGVPNYWGPPQFKGSDGHSSWQPWQTNLESSLRPSIGLPPRLLQRAYDDYFTTLKNLLDRRPFWKDEMKPLDRLQTVNGIEQKRFVDRMPADTSVGFPLSGPKSNYLTEIKAEGYQYATELDAQFWDEAERMKQCYREGKRAYPIFKATLKDEPTETTSSKVRVFQAAPLALQLLIRQYYLPLCRFLSCNPLKSECAVGINPHSPEWDQLHGHISKFGDKCLAIDYKKYDTRMPCQLMYASFGIFIDLARYTGNYTVDDIQVMQGIATDVCTSVVANNGDLISHIGTNPSGHNLTVYSNSINNSLLHRCGFFHTYPDCKKLFSECAAITTYGDDAAGTVSSEYSDFNMISYRDFLAEYDIQITMAVKDAEFEEYISIEDVDFLKRKFVYHPDLRLHMAAIDIKSMMKPLHSGLNSAVPEAIIAADALDNCLRESLYHGKEFYEDARRKVKIVAEKEKLLHIVRLADESYEHMLYAWACKHDVEKRLEQSKYAEVAASKTKQSHVALITGTGNFFPDSSETLCDV